MTDHWKDVNPVNPTGLRPVYYAPDVDAARAKDAELLAAKDAEIATLRTEVDSWRQRWSDADDHIRRLNALSQQQAEELVLLRRTRSTQEL